MDAVKLSTTEQLTVVRFSMMYPYAGRDVNGVELRRLAYEAKQAGFEVRHLFKALMNALSFWVTLKQPMIPHPYDFIRYEMRLFLPKKTDVFL